jgi:hypothetical protein
MAEEVCPSCGAKRVGSFRFCRECGLDFDSQVDPAVTSASPPFAGMAYGSAPPKAARRPSIGGLLVLILVVLAILGVGYVASESVLR